MKDFMNYFSGKVVMGNGARITTGTVESDAVDVTALNGGNDGLCFVVAIGDIDATNGGSHVFSLEESIDGGSTYTAVAAPYVQTPLNQTLGSSGAPVTYASTAAKTILKFGYLGSAGVKTLGDSVNPTANGKVLVKLVDTCSSGSTGAYITAIAIFGYPFKEPAV